MYTVIPYYRMLYRTKFEIFITVVSAMQADNALSDRILFAAARSYIVREFLNLSLVLGLGVWLKLTFRNSRAI